MRKLLCAALLTACASTPKPPAVTSSATTSTAPSTAAPTAAAAPLTPPAAAVAEQVVATDTPWADPDGNTFIVPAGWKVSTFASMTVVTAPEGNSRIAFVDVAAPDSAAARAAGWKAYKPDAAWPVLTTSESPDRDGWSKGRDYGYQTSPNEKRTVAMSTVFANGRWLVVILDVDDGVAEKRGGQLAVMFSHLYPKGFTKESFHGKVAAKLDAAKLAELTKFVADAAQATGVPGVSFGVVQDGKVVWAGGVGVRELGKPAKVDAKTMYMIASNTKALTTLMLAKLVDAGQLRWDQAVTQVLPSFKLGNAEVTKQVLVKHLICACTGMPRQDLEWLLEWKDATPASVLVSLGTMMPTSKFGELFQYSNLMAAAGGYVGGHAKFPTLELGAAYDKAMQTLVFDPLGMTSTTFDYGRALRANHAMPHGLDIDGKPAPALMNENYSVIAARPAGAAWSNVEDMLKYVQLELDLGKLPGGKPYVSEAALLARRIPNVAIGADAAYGMGLIISHKYGVTVIAHGGDLIGYHSDMMWLPDANVGAVILTNGDLGPAVRSGFQRRLLELLYDGKPEAVENVATAAKNTFEEMAATRKLLSVPADPAEAKKLAKHYRNDRLGEVTVLQDKGKVWFDVGEFKSEVGTVKNPDGTVTFTTIVPGLAGLGFVVGVAGGKPTLTIRDSQHEYVFTAQ